jgi:glyoxylase-like metal-dependent hydrolase (beta-lactamase superfamily II)
MRRLGPAFCVLIALALVVGQSAASFAAGQAVTTSPGRRSPELTLTKEVLADGVYLFRAPTALDRWTATNVVVIVNQDDVTVFDSFTRPATARMAIAEIRALTSKPVRTLINSHWHMDHWSGNDEFRKAFPGIQIIATVETRGYMTRMGSQFLIDGTRTGLTRSRDALATAIKTGRLSDGTVLTDDLRREQEREIDETSRFVDEVIKIPRVLPDVAFRDELTFWRGAREFRLFSMTGDATGSAVLYLPAEKILVTGDVLVSPPDGQGPPPWTTNSYAIAPWLMSLRRLETFDSNVIVPGQGPAMRDTTYLRLTVQLFTGIVDGVHRALERGIYRADEVVAAVNLDAIGRQYPQGQTGPDTPFGQVVARLVRKAAQEALDGIVR